MAEFRKNQAKNQATVIRISLKNSVTDSITKAEILAVRKYGEIFGKPSHFGPYKYVL